MKLQTSFVVADFSWAYLALPLSYNVGFLDGYSGSEDLFHGPATGLSLYLKEVAMPAVSIQFARDVEKGNNKFSFSIGMKA